MPKCCGGTSRCTCRVTAGPGVTVDGNGSPTTPYVISAGAATPTAVQDADTPTVDTTVSGTGAAGDPYVVSSTVILDPTPPGGGDNLLSAGPDGLYVECADVRQCISAGDGAAYDPTTGVVSARLSADAGNTMAIGADGGLYSAGGGGGAPSVVTAADTPTLNATVTGTGAAGDPYVVSGDVVVAPEPNGVETAPNGLLVAPSADTGNRLTFGADNRLFVPPAPPPEVGCGLQGDGTASAPLAAALIAGQQEWAEDWACDAARHSTVKCDPVSGAIWAPPEHYSAAETIYVEHFVGGWSSPIGPTGGWAIVDPGAVWQFQFPANFLGNECRRWTYDLFMSGTWDINHTSTAVFELGYVYSWNGGPATVRPLWGLLTAPGAARRERDNGSMHEYGYNLAPGVAHSVVGWPAVRVVAGSLTINSWISDGGYHTTTMHN